MSFSRRIAVWSLVLGVIVSGSALWAQEGNDDVADPSAPAVQEPQDEEKEKTPFALYVAASAGIVTADPIDTSLSTLVTHTANTTLDLEDAQLSRVGLGWKLKNGKGDFRVNVQNFKEDGYHVQGAGYEAAIVNPGISAPAVQDNLLWWTVDVVDGDLVSTLTPPMWDLAHDTNLDMQVQAEEVFYDPGAEIVITTALPEDLENRTQTIDLLYGREFGRRRVSSRWWAGMRYFVYEGNLPATAWLSTFPDGSGFTDGNLFHLLNYRQESEGFGPTGSLEIDFNFFAERFTLYLQGTAAFTVLSLDSDTGEFVTLVRAEQGGSELTYPARLQQSRNKSTWQNAIEAGMRLNLANGIGLELSYSVTGYLDVILSPTEMRVPQTAQEGPQGASALFNTQDLVYDGWRAGFSFQF